MPGMFTQGEWAGVGDKHVVCDEFTHGTAVCCTEFKLTFPLEMDFIFI